MPQIDKFAPVRFCDNCCEDVAVEFREKTVQMYVEGEMADITYTASFCPKCGQPVCERDFDDALEQYVAEKHKALWPKEQE